MASVVLSAVVLSAVVLSAVMLSAVMLSRLQRESLCFGSLRENSGYGIIPYS